MGVSLVRQLYDYPTHQYVNKTRRQTLVTSAITTLVFCGVIGLATMDYDLHMSAQADNTTSASIPTKHAHVGNDAKIADAVHNLMSERLQLQPQPTGTSGQTSSQQPKTEPAVNVVVYLEKGTALPKNIPTGYRMDDTVYVSLTSQQIRQIAALDNVIAIEKQSRATPATIKGSEYTYADRMHARGFNGSGIQVGVIDGGV